MLASPAGARLPSGRRLATSARSASWMSLKLLSRFMRTRGRASRPSPAGSRLWRDFLLLKGELPAEGVAGKQL